MAKVWLALSSVLSLVAASGPVVKVDTSGWIGAEYQPSKSANEDWLFHYEVYRDDVLRELPLVRHVLGFSALRIFLHSMIYFASPSKLIGVIDDFLSIADNSNMKVGFVFFDDCWNHAGLNLSRTCQPTKGKHNACWMASPQDAERHSKRLDDFKPYVVDIVTKFKDDKRVLWWEIFNEPRVQDNVSEAFRHAGFQWAHEVRPSQPIASCWDEASDKGAAIPLIRFNSELNDHHQYTLPWNGIRNAVFVNSSGLMRGGLVTEAGARWYQGMPQDNGSPLTVIDWLTKLRSDPAAPFVPGVMMNWEVMVSNSNTRWHWDSPVDHPEPAIPWCGHLFPDGTPVSYTEAAAIRAYATGRDDFLYLANFLAADNNESNEVVHHIADGSAWLIDEVFEDFLVEVSVWPATDAIITLTLRNSSSGFYSVILDAPSKSLALLRSGEVLQTFDATKLENGILASAIEVAEGSSLMPHVPAASWNILRVLVKGSEVSIWLNPMYQETFKGGVFPMPGEPSVAIQPMPPRIVLSDPESLPGGTISVAATKDGALIDYISVLPPVLYGSGDLTNGDGVIIV